MYRERTGHGQRDARERHLSERLAAGSDRAAAHFAVVVHNVDTLPDIQAHEDHEAQLSDSQSIVTISDGRYDNGMW